MQQVGTITQLPPVRSRVKRVERERKIYAIEIKNIERRQVEFDVECQAGTYIRKLCHDMGVELAGYDDDGIAIGHLVFGNGIIVGNPGEDLFEITLEPGKAIYAYSLTILEDAHVNLNGANIYYMTNGYSYNGHIGGGFDLQGSYTPGGGGIYEVPIPTPTAWAGGCTPGRRGW